jgi:protein involved in polysaccharide export with SLBB domain
MHRLMFVAAVAAGFGLTFAAARVTAQDAAPPGQSSQAVAAPRTDAGAAHSYKLRADDEIEIAVHRPGSFDAQLVRKFTVPTDGEISFSPIGKVDVVGKSVFEVEAEITRRLKEMNYLKEPNVGCIVTKYAQRTASVIGALQSSIQLPVHQELRILDVLSRVGAFGAEGVDLAHVEIRRTGDGGATFRFDVNVDDVYSGQDESQNVIVREGDIIKIPRLGGASSPETACVYALGHLAKPGCVRIPKSRSAFTLVKLISVCGDFTDFGNRSKVRLIRQGAKGPEITIYDFDEIIEGKRPDVELKDEDVVFVPESFF